MTPDREATFTARNRDGRAAIGLVLLALSFASCNRAQTGCEPQLPNPSGTFAVGRLNGQHLTDSTRPDRFSPERTKHRELMVYVWYPAQQSNHPSFEAYVPEAKRIEASVCGRQRMREEFEAVWPMILSDQLRSHVLANATPAVRSGGFPVVLFSHGLGSTTFAYTAQIEDLISHGYVVIAIEHTDMATAVLFPDGQVRCFQTRTPGAVGNGMDAMMAAVKRGSSGWRRRHPLCHGQPRARQHLGTCPNRSQACCCHRSLGWRDDGRADLSIGQAYRGLY